MLSLLALVPVVAAYPSLAPVTLASTCSPNLPASCQNTTAVSDTCCFVTSGELVQTQFWDTDPAVGPSDSWGIHGLWPDNCDGTYPENCDSSREYSSITDILQNAGQDDLITYMKTYWQSNNGSPESFWEHEWNTHGTCVSTLEPSCYSDYSEGDEVVEYFNKVVSLFKTLPTYQWLADAGINPGSDTYTRDEILAPLQSNHGAKVVIGCSGGALSSVNYYFNVKGSLQDGTYEAVDPSVIKGGCPSSGIKYEIKPSS